MFTGIYWLGWLPPPGFSRVGCFGWPPPHRLLRSYCPGWLPPPIPPGLTGLSRPRLPDPSGLTVLGSSSRPQDPRAGGLPPPSLHGLRSGWRPPPDPSRVCRRPGNSLSLAGVGPPPPPPDPQIYFSETKKHLPCCTTTPFASSVGATTLFARGRRLPVKPRQKSSKRGGGREVPDSARFEGQPLTPPDLAKMVIAPTELAKRAVVRQGTPCPSIVLPLQWASNKASGADREESRGRLLCGSL